jgi:hypothetical protein
MSKPIFKIVTSSPCHDTRDESTIDTSKVGEDGIVAVDSSEKKCRWCGKPYVVPAYAIKLSSQ